ncbi:Uncharacterised protein [Moraxella lacunata]|uniref:Uncharacterized protein n=1 Tax=Moraxella lacunata TaxID=477 RepID=A0A378TSE2_MORLA|nr:hypothetical protein [Moraxella lacunata]STZ63561.1 Uncharacterised protein [Moraxella lacunata]
MSNMQLVNYSIKKLSRIEGQGMVMIGFSNGFLVILTLKILGGALGMILFILGWAIFALLCQDSYYRYGDYDDYIKIDDSQNEIVNKCRYLKDRIIKIKYYFLLYFFTVGIYCFIFMDAHKDIHQGFSILYGLWAFYIAYHYHKFSSDILYFIER